jgi:hypothetical protein
MKSVKQEGLEKEQTPKPPPCAHPLALRFCARARRIANIAGMVSCISLTLLLFLGFLAVMMPRAQLFGLLFFICGLIIQVSFGLVVIFIVLRFFVVLIFFARYSLKQMLGAILVLNILLVFAVSFNIYVSVAAILNLIFFTGMAGLYILAQDPSGFAHTPDFFREYLERKKKPPQ